jgi:methanogenic corrinoid protein MtbC1
MSARDLLKQVAQSIVDLDSEGCRRACERALEAGVSPLEVISDGLARGTEVVGEKYQSKKFFLSELTVTGDVVQESMEILKPHIRAAETSPRGKVILGTVKVDLHDIGKTSSQCS